MGIPVTDSKHSRLRLLDNTALALFSFHMAGNLASLNLRFKKDLTLWIFLLLLNHLPPPGYQIKPTKWNSTSTTHRHWPPLQKILHLVVADYNA